MIFPTHMLVGGLVGAVISLFAPVHPILAVLAGMVAAVVPDLDLLMEHRKTLHRPVQYTTVSAALLGLTAFVPHAATALVTATVASLAVHSWMEALTEGQGIREDAMDAERAVYNHVRNEWMAARELTPVGGIPDIVFGLSAGLLTVTFAPAAAVIVVPVMALSVLFGASRDRIFAWIPDRFETPSGFATHAAEQLVEWISSRDSDSDD